MASKTVPPLDILSPEHKDKAKASSSGSKSIKSKSSPTKSIDIKNVKKCSNSELRMLARTLNKRLSELCEDEIEDQEASSYNSAQLGQGSINTKDHFTIVNSTKMVKTHLPN